VRRDQLGIDAAGDERLQGRPVRRRPECIQPPLGQIGDARRKTEAEHPCQREYMVADTAAIGVVDGRGEVRFVVEQAVDHVRGFAGRRDRDRMERCVTGRHMSVLR
jgi:hypothetical protein